MSSRWSRASSNIRRCILVMGLKEPQAIRTTLDMFWSSIAHYGARFTWQKHKRTSRSATTNYTNGHKNAEYMVCVKLCVFVATVLPHRTYNLYSIRNYNTWKYKLQAIDNVIMNILPYIKPRCSLITKILKQCFDFVFDLSGGSAPMIFEFWRNST